MLHITQPAYHRAKNGSQAVGLWRPDSGKVTSELISEWQGEVSQAQFWDRTFPGSKCKGAKISSSTKRRPKWLKQQVESEGKKEKHIRR